jgi:hypothetical protein
LAITGNVSANNFNYANGVSILDSVTSSLATLTSNAATQSGLIIDTNTAITTANTNMKGYVDGQITTVSNSVTGANAAIVTANTALKGYIDGQITTLVGGAPAILDTLNEIANALGNDANLSVTLTNSISGSNAAIVTANTAMKGYVDAGIIWSISASGTSDYVFSGPGIVTGNTNDPVLYLYRGFTYTFINTTGSSHPFAIRVSNGGADYTTGVSGSQTSTQIFTVPMNAPSTLYYQCTIHSSMGNVINIV